MSATTATPPSATPAPVSTPAPPERIALKECFSVRPDLMETAASGCKVVPLANGRFRVKAKGQHTEVVNRNGRRYPTESTWGKHTKTDAAFMQRVKSRRVIGQLEHPESGRSSMGLAAVVVTEVYPPNDKGEVFIEFETMSTPGGQVVSSFIRDGVGFGISSRGNGSVMRIEGVDVVQDDFEPVTFDLVVDESTPGAEVVANKVKEALGRAKAVLMESVKGDEAKAVQISEAQTRAAMARDSLGEQMPPRGDSEYLLGIDDGSAHYRAYDNGVGQWDVWFLPHNLDPIRIASAMPTLKNAKGSAEEHLRLVVGQSAGTPQVAVARQGGGQGAAPKVVVNVESKVAEGLSATVGSFLTVLVGNLTQYDAANAARAMKAGHFVNIYALGHYLGAAHEVAAQVKSLEGKDDPESMKALIAAMSHHFDPALPPVKKTIKAITAWVTSGVVPKYPIAPAMESAKPRVKNKSVKAVRESFVVANEVPFNGVMLSLDFDNAKEAEKAGECLADAGFDSWSDDEELVVYVPIGDPDQAVAQVRRCLVSDDIQMTDQGEAALIRNGRVIREARFRMATQQTNRTRSESESGRDAPAGAGEYKAEVPPGSAVRAPMVKMASPAQGKPWEDDEEPKDKKKATEDDKDDDKKKAEADDDDKKKDAKAEADDDKKKDKDEADKDDDDDKKKSEAAFPTAGAKGDSKTWRPQSRAAVREEDEDPMAFDPLDPDGDGDIDLPGFPGDDDDDAMAIEPEMAYGETGSPGMGLEWAPKGARTEARMPRMTAVEWRAFERGRKTEASRRLRGEADDKDDKDKKEADDKDDKDAKKEARRRRTEADDKDSKKEADDDKKKDKDERAARARARYEGTVRSARNAYMAEVSGTGFGPNVPIDDPEDLDVNLDRSAAPGQVPNKPKEKDPAFSSGGMTSESVIRLSGGFRKPVQGKTNETHVPCKAWAGKAVSKIKFLEGELSRLESTNQRLSSLVDEMAQVQAQEQVKGKIAEVISKHPELEGARTRLEKCDSLEAVMDESAALLGVLREARRTSTVVAPITEGASVKPSAPAQIAHRSAMLRGTSVTSARTEGAPSGPLAEDSSSAAKLFGGLKESSSTVDDTASRVADHRRRQRQARLRGQGQ